MKIINQPVKRLFAFGCSFTNYGWSTWPEIISLDLEIPHWNYGRCGAGNQFISNMLTQADNLHDFNDDDLVIVSWTNACREDRWINDSWITPGNIFTQGFYDKKFIKHYVDPVGYLLRDLSLISLAAGFLDSKNCQYHFFSMCDLIEQLDQGEQIKIDNNKPIYHDLVKQYSKTHNKIHPSFYKTLWNNDIHKNKFAHIDKLYHNKFNDGHPTPDEHLLYLQKTFPGHQFKDTTKTAVAEKYNILNAILFDKINKSKKPFAIYELESEYVFSIKEKTKIKNSEKISII